MLRIVAALGVCCLLSSAVFAQAKLTKELGEKVRTAEGKLTEQEVLKLAPGPVTVSRVIQGAFGSVDAEWLLRWEEATKFEVVLIDGKVIQLSATFCDTAPSKKLTLEVFKQLKEGMSLGDIEKVLGSPNSAFETIDDMNTKTTRCVWSRGFEIRTYVKNGKVNGGGFIDTLDK